MYVNVVFVIRRVYSAVSLVREQRFIRIIIMITSIVLPQIIYLKSALLTVHPLRSHKVLVYLKSALLTVHPLRSHKLFVYSCLC